MSNSLSATLPGDLKTKSQDRSPAEGHVTASSGKRREPKRINRRGLFLFAAGVVVLSAAAFWFLSNAGYETTDDAFVESHVIQVSPKISAHVKALYFDDNYRVKRGELLIELDARDYEVALASAIANLASAQGKLTESEAQQNVVQAGLGQVKADLASARATAENAESDFKRNEQLYKTHVIDRREYDASAAQAKTAAASVESASKRVASQDAQIRLASAQYVTASAEEKQAETQVQQAKLQLSYTKIFSPFDGHVTKKNIEPGNYVQPGQTLLSLVPPDVWVVANFKETQLKKMKVGQSVSVRVDALPGRDFKAHLESMQFGTGSRFTLLPPENATGNFVKVVQRVPVKIVFDEAPADLERLSAGESVEPRVDTHRSSLEQSHRAAPLPAAILGTTEGP
ncbi:MAG: HlyD family secretion protein [Verrucomicrobia bacterium]|nr:HlyD family secretion protein [Verrucomicrobiota bacterium]